MINIVLQAITAHWFLGWKFWFLHAQVWLKEFPGWIKAAMFVYK